MSENNHGGARAGAGRKKGGTNKGEKRDKRIVIVCTESEYNQIKLSAEKARKTVTKLLLDIALSQ